MFTVDAITFQNAHTVLDQGYAALAKGEREIDLAGIGAADSSAVAVLLAWRRAAQAQGSTVVYRNLPASLRSLADVYGVDGLLD